MADTANNLPAILPVGTAVVTKVAAGGAGGEVTSPAGAVGVIVRAPADAGHSYRVRLPGGEEVTLRRDEFAVLKHFQKQGMGAAHSDAMSEYDLHQYVIYRCIVGSRAYGLAHAESDIDRRGVYLPPAQMQWSLFGVPEQLENKETDECYWELQKFLTMALKANPNILEVLNSPIVEHATDLGRELLELRPAFLSKLVYQTYNGYVMSQFKKLGSGTAGSGTGSAAVSRCLSPLSRPGRTDEGNRQEQTGPGAAAGNDGDRHGQIGAKRRSVWTTPEPVPSAEPVPIKWKHAMHLIRLLSAGITVLREGRVPVAIDDDAIRQRLLAIRRGQVPWDEVNAWRLDLHRQFDDAFRTTALPDRPNYEAANAFLIKARKSMVR